MTAVDGGFNQFQLWSAVVETWHEDERANLVPALVIGILDAAPFPVRPHDLTGVAL